MNNFESKLAEYMDTTKGAWKYHILKIDSIDASGSVWTVSIYSKLAKHLRTVEFYA